MINKFIGNKIAVSKDIIKNTKNAVIATNKDNRYYLTDVEVLSLYLALKTFRADTKSQIEDLFTDYRMSRSVIVGKHKVRIQKYITNLLKELKENKESKKLIEKDIKEMCGRDVRLSTFVLNGEESFIAEIIANNHINWCGFEKTYDVFYDKDNEQFKRMVYLISTRIKENKEKELFKGYWFNEPSETKNLLRVTPKYIGVTLNVGKRTKKVIRKLHQQKFSLNKDLWNKVKDKAFELRKDVQQCMASKEGWKRKYLEKIRYRWKEVDKIFNEKDFIGCSWHPDSRGRLYVNHPVTGLNPQGKLWEVLLWELKEPKEIGREGVKYIRWYFASVYWEGLGLNIKRPMFDKRVGFKLDKDKAKELAEKTIKDFDKLLEQCKDLDELGELVLRYKISKDYLGMIGSKSMSKYKTKSMYGRDLNNGGLIMLITSYFLDFLYKVTGLIRDPNIEPDSYLYLVKKLGLKRYLIKKIYTAFLHGYSFKLFVKDIRAIYIEQFLEKGEAKVIKEYEKFARMHSKVKGKVLKQKFVEYYSNKLLETDDNFRNNFSDYALEQMLKEAYKYAIDIVNEIKKIGWLLSPLGQIFFNSTDGELWFSEHYVQHPEKFPVIKTEYNEKYSFERVENKYFKENVGIELTGYGFRSLLLEGYDAKMLGSFTNITHSKDAQILRSVIKGVDYILPKHDDYITHPSEMDKVDEILRKELANSGGYHNEVITSIIIGINKKIEKLEDGILKEYLIYAKERVKNHLKVLENYQEIGDPLFKIEGNGFLSIDD